MDIRYLIIDDGENITWEETKNEGLALGREAMGHSGSNSFAKHSDGNVGSKGPKAEVFSVDEEVFKKVMEE